MEIFRPEVVGDSSDGGEGFTHDFWAEEKQPEEFNYGRLGILPKKV